MNYELVCLDMDGTLLNDEKKISENNREGIKKLLENNIKVAVTTGRPFLNASYFADLLGGNLPIIASNGAYIYQKGIGVIFSKAFTKENVIKLIKIIKENGLYPQFHGIDNIYTEKLEYSPYYVSQFNNIIPENNRMSINKISSFKSILDVYQNEFLKCISIDNNEGNISRVRKEINKLGTVDVVSSGINNIEITEKGVSKGNAIEAYAKYMNIDLKNVAAIGDSENDLSMIKTSGLGIAMGNAIDEVKKEANLVTLSNNEDGVAYAISNYILS